MKVAVIGCGHWGHNLVRVFHEIGVLGAGVDYHPALPNKNRPATQRMGTLPGEGRTVLFVSHNMAAIQALCSRAILIRQARVVIDAPASDAVLAYLKTLEEAASQNLADRTERGGKGGVRLIGVDASGGDVGTSAPLVSGRPAHFIFQVRPPCRGISCAFTFYDPQGAALASFDSAVHSPHDVYNPGESEHFSCQIEELLLVPGRYRMDVAIRGKGELQDHVEAATFINVEPGHLRGRAVSRGRRTGSVCMHHYWALPS